MSDPKDKSYGRTGKVANEAIGGEQGGHDYSDISDSNAKLNESREFFSHDTGKVEVIGS